MAERPPNPESTRVTCPRCNSDQIDTLSSNNPRSEYRWFMCKACPHMWTNRRYRTQQGERPTAPRPDSEVDGG